MIEQGELSLKHMTLLRRAITEQRSGAASFEGRDWACALPFERGALLGSDASERLCKVLQEPVLGFEWDDTYRNPDGNMSQTLPRSAIPESVAALNLPMDRLMIYRKMFAKLPDVRVRYLLGFRFYPEYQRLFQSLYHMSLATGKVCLDDYFASAANFIELRKRMNIIIAAYCMGGLLSAVKNNATFATASRVAASIPGAAKLNVVSRVLTRLRGGA